MRENRNNVLDQYFTKREVSKQLYNTTIKTISKYEKDISSFTWIEPSVGEGCFFDELPIDRRIGIDIEPKRTEVIRSDYLLYDLPKGRIIVIGNPPFGHRGVLALEFINHSQNAEYVAFILPMFFKSLGKGSIRYRVKGFSLIHEEDLPEKSFYLANGKDVDVKCCFQIWSKNHNADIKEYSWYNNKDNEPFHDYVKLVTVSLAKKRECGKEWIFDKKADWYISSSFFKENTVVKNFEEVKYKSGIAIIYKTKNATDRKRLDNVFMNAKWTQYASLATNGCYHLGKSNIFKLLQDTIGEKNNGC
ncbi:MAG: SAM-dependent methyltransferase [Clostridia bacterium]|nr:SAM-dependent methyltransferase [Clostridia bacterium]